jgi:hypothetical protein
MEQNYLQTLSEIRSMMERSSRFISLSGLSGVGAGVMALIGATAAFVFLNKIPFDGKIYYTDISIYRQKGGSNLTLFLFLDALAVVISAVSVGIFFTTRKAKRKGQKVWDKLTWRLLVNLAIPLFAGGVFCLALLYHNLPSLIAPSTLIFYGLSLVQGSKYTLNDVRYLGLSELALGLVAVFNLGYGLEFWTIGFGLLHIIYGSLMYWKYERTA